MNKKVTFLFASILLLAHRMDAESPTPFRALARMPVKEITVFKDGHAFVLHSGKMPTDEKGNVVMDYLPAPVIGTFWPFSADRKAKLSSVTASQRKVMIEKTALTLHELIEANAGASVVVTEVPSAGNPESYPATIVGIPRRSGEELEAFDPPNSGEKLSQNGNVVFLKTDAGVKVVALDRIRDIRFVRDWQKSVSQEEMRSMLTLKLDWDGGKAQKDIEVGLLYLQRGIRWIPSYKVTIDGAGKASVRLQATLINELADLEDVTAHLVIGAPSFEFKETPDPMALQQTAAALSPYFRQDAQTAYGFANALMSQQVAGADNRMRMETDAPRPVDLGPEVGESGKTEDLFIFEVKHVTMKKGQRMVITIGDYTMKYKDVFTLDVPFAPPVEVWRNFESSRQAELAKLFNALKVMHKIRLVNETETPLTTAPTLIMKDDRLLAQSLMTYTAPGADIDVNVTTAVDIRVKKVDNETKRVPNAVTWQGDQYGRIDLAGKITLTNFRKDAVEVEITRNVLGNVESADSGGKTEMVNVLEDPSLEGAAGRYPYWWGWFSWPWWWRHFNGVGRITWTATLPPQKPIDLGYNWNYFWR